MRAVSAPVRLGRSVPVLAAAVGIMLILGSCADTSGSSSGRATSAASSTSPSTSTATNTDPSDEASRVLLEEDFEGGQYQFWTGRDSELRAEVVDGVYEFEVIDLSLASPVRSILPIPADGVRFESTVTVGPRGFGWLYVGCWSGERSYATLISGDRFIGITEEGSGSLADRQMLMDMTQSLLVNPATYENRIRLDCVASDDGGWFSVYVNETPVASLPIRADVESFDAVGFIGIALVEGLVYRIDDVVAFAERPQPPEILTVVEDHPETLTDPVVFEYDGTSFVYPNDWKYFNYGGDFFEVPGAWSFAVTPSPSQPAGDWIVLSVAPGVVPEALDATPEDFTYDVLEFVTSAGGSVADDPVATTVGGLPAATATLEGFVGSKTGDSYDGRIAIIFGEDTTFLLFAQYSQETEAQIGAAWDDALASFEP